jgi:hypothetical protein
VWWVIEIQYDIKSKTYKIIFNYFQP